MSQEKFLGWEYKLAEREMNREGIPEISKQFWREALGIDRKTPVAEALQILQSQEAA